MVNKYQLGDPTKDVEYRSLKKNLMQVIKGCNTKSNAERKHIERDVSLYADNVGPFFWLKYFNMFHQTPLCIMHMWLLGIIKCILLGFALFYGSIFINFINDSIHNYPYFEGIQQFPRGLFTKNKKRNKITLNHLNAD